MSFGEGVATRNLNVLPVEPKPWPCPFKVGTDVKEDDDATGDIPNGVICEASDCRGDGDDNDVDDCVVNGE
jgi:hypothetical protein